ncbi:cofactor-independent phosphoglycerate mutase [Alkalibaculum sp. M08DMB]|uniref:Cofactor-independent phosphoglycerate mutase n=1 Tax=Alkalibaculum sporogenes TaxID=2655001 RepID=A0A6A7KCF8_9FIRM|nr:cofactor-independent phosphoglycerate mutase [Alkalibaculum sporogenes]MPW26703.1 cofactor-independent phosphoglycerate mutase [Alkalibaculum sporogenes]
MKYIIILVDGAGDYTIESIGNKTPLEVANIPNITNLAQNGEIGLVQTIPVGMQPGSDIANLSVMGYAPEKYHTGRSPLEAASMGVPLSDTDITFRCNLVTLSEDKPYQEKTILDHSSGDITTEESTQLIETLSKQLQTEFIKYYPGVSYRHLILWKNGLKSSTYDFDLTPPHDILGQSISNYLPKGPHQELLTNMMEKSYDILKNHPVNVLRTKKGLNPASSIWIWGEGKKPRLDSFKEKFGLAGSVISAVDLIHGIGILAGLKPIKVDGATGTIHTNFSGKASAAVKALLDGDDFVYLHLEAPDECGHQGNLQEKIESIEIIDHKIVGPIKTALEEAKEEFKVLILPDHLTPIKLRTHTSDPVPYVIYDSRTNSKKSDNRFTEKSAKESGNFFLTGPELTSYFFK